jgi:Fic family protein
MGTAAGGQLDHLTGDLTTTTQLHERTLGIGHISSDIAVKRPPLQHQRIWNERFVLAAVLIEHGGRVRDEQNWFGGSELNPCSAAFIPPPPDRLGPLLADLVTFANTDELPAVAQAAIVHAQFETIHPFVDGNGRTGRALIHLVLRRRGLSARVLAPVSLILATRAADDIAGLNATRAAPTTAAAERSAGWNRWIGTFAAAVTRATDDARAFQRAITAIQTSWRAQIGSVRANSATELLIERLPAAPVLTIGTGAQLIDRSVQATNEAIRGLVNAGVLKQTTTGKRHRLFEAPDIIGAFTTFERQLASPTGNTAVEPPARPAPAKRGDR